MPATISQRNLFPLILLFPSLLFLFAFTYLPFGVALVESFYEFRGIEVGGEVFSGLENYSRLFADPAFRKACVNNLLLVAITTAPGLALALWLAVMLRRSATFSRILRSIFFFPTVVPLVAASSLWIFIFLPGMGLIDHYLTRYFGMSARNYLGDERTALIALAVLSIWKFAGYYMVFFVAALQSIPDDALEAAVLEGAGPWQSFRLVTLPLLRPTITFVGVIAVIYAVTQVDHIMMMTNGGPNNSTSVLLFYIFTTAQDGHDLGKASAATVLTLGALLLITVFNMNILERGTHYEQ